MLAGGDVRELIREHDRVEVSPRVERADRVRVVRPAFVTGNVTLLRPARAPVERLEESREVVVALAVDDPLADADQVAGIRRIDVQVGFGEVLRAERWVSDVLRRIRADVLSRRRSLVAQRRAAVRISLRRREAALAIDLRRVTADPLSGCCDAGHVTLGVAGPEGGIRLEALRRRRGRGGPADPPAGRNPRGGASFHPEGPNDVPRLRTL